MNYDKIDLKWSNMLAGIHAQVPYVKNSPRLIYDDIKASLKLNRPPEKVYLVGCGDSWYCGMSTRQAFQAWAGIQAEALQAMEFSRYHVQYAPANSLVLTVSNSGRVSRTIECVAQANLYGLTSAAATSNLKEGISQEAQYTIDLAYSERCFAPGTSSYMASMMVEYCLALYLAELKGRMSATEVEEKLALISSLAEPMQETIDACLPIMENLASRVKLSDQVIFLGSGPNYGTAFFSMAKVIESARMPAAGQEMEEWAHEQYFLTNERTHTFVLAPPGESISRARELVSAIKAMRSSCIVVCDPEDKETAAGADLHVPIYGSFSELLSPILYCIPAELFAFHLAVANDLVMLGFDNPLIKEVNFQQIFHSQVKRG